MKIGDRVKIRNRKDIKTDIYLTPGWNSQMNKYCGKSFEIYSINRDKYKPWVELSGSDIEYWTWHIEWLIEQNLLPDELFEI